MCAGLTTHDYPVYWEKDRHFSFIHVWEGSLLCAVCTSAYNVTLRYFARHSTDSTRPHFMGNAAALHSSVFPPFLPELRLCEGRDWIS